MLIGDDPLNLKIVSLGLTKGDASPYGGRYPCGSLVHNGVWYYGTYCLAPDGMVRYGDQAFNWPWLGPFVGFRTSTDFGKTWTDTPHTPAKPLFGETGMWGYPVKIGSPHFVDFGKNMEHSPDGKAYLVAHGAAEPDPKPRFGNLSWITGDQIYLLRVTPSIENINDASKYEFFAGHDAAGKPVWTSDFAKIKPLIDWNNNCGCVTITYNAPLKTYLMCVTDGWPTCAKMNSYILEAERDHRPLAARDLHEGLRRAGLLPEHPDEVHQRRRPHGVALLLRQLRQETGEAKSCRKSPPAATTASSSSRSACSTKPRSRNTRSE